MAAAGVQLCPMRTVFDYLHLCSWWPFAKVSLNHRLSPWCDYLRVMLGDSETEPLGSGCFMVCPVFRNPNWGFGRRSAGDTADEHRPTKKSQ